MSRLATRNWQLATLKFENPYGSRKHEVRAQFSRRETLDWRISGLEKARREDGRYQVLMPFGEGFCCGGPIGVVKLLRARGGCLGVIRFGRGRLR